MIAYSLVALVAIIALSFIILTIRAFLQWRRGWRWAAAVPLVLLAGVVFNIFNAIRIDPTAHNLWPIELLAYFIVAGIVMGVLYLAHWINNRRVAA